MSRGRVLLLEDDVALRALLHEVLDLENFDTAAKAVPAVSTNQVDISSGVLSAQPGIRTRRSRDAQSPPYIDRKPE